MLSCQGTDTARICAQASDCASDTANPNCCSLRGYFACVSDQVKTLASLTCK
jgi:hypothetical protein